MLDEWSKIMDSLPFKGEVSARAMLISRISSKRADGGVENGGEP